MLDPYYQAYVFANSCSHLSFSKPKKEGKKRKKIDDKPSLQKKAQKTSSVADAARVRVASAVASNDVLSSLFTSQRGNVSEKERNDNLFAR
jgi:hypothetical protein